MMNGSMWVNSTTDQGSCFYFTAEFLLAEHDNHTAQNSSESQLHNENLEYSSNLNKYYDISKDKTENPCNKTILIVDDNEINQRLISSLLDKKGYNYISALNGNEALKILDCQIVDLILMDIQMPELNGLKTTTAIRNKESTKVHIPIIAMTAYAMIGDKESFLDTGMDDYISKPIDFKIFYDTIHKYL
ncbi:response regulator [Clostridiaceae bacterium UIB06]|nr:response regulator [Clostridiaceae bacterium UIB06]